MWEGNESKREGGVGIQGEVGKKRGRQREGSKQEKKQYKRIAE